MKGRSILLDRLAGRRVAALIEDGRLEDLLYDPPPSAPPGPGAIARARPDRKVKGMGGIFVRLPDGLTGFLRGEKGVAPGSSMVVQVSGHAEPGKALPCTQRLLFKSRFAIVTPGAPGLNISRSIKGEEARAPLAALATAGMSGSDMGLILRSASANADVAAIAEDIEVMRRLAEAVTSDAGTDIEWLTEEPDAHHRAWRDWPQPDELDETPGCLAERGVLEDIAALAGPEHALPGGGFLSVEPTRALVAVDVNTGPDTSPAAALKANLAALRALPRALRLRGLGGQITVDLAPLAKKDRRQAEQVLRTALKADPVETTFLGWTPLGHMELTRKRERLPIDPALWRAAA